MAAACAIPALALAVLLSSWRPCAGRLEGSLDACVEGDVPWTDVRNAIFGYLAGHTAADRITRLKDLSLSGGIDPYGGCDCWYGWICARFFTPVILDEEQRGKVLEQQLFHTEWLLWLGSPWIEMLDSIWDVPTVLAAAARAIAKSEADTESCGSLDLQFREQLSLEEVGEDRPASPGLARLAARVLLGLPEEMLAEGLGTDVQVAWQGPCPAHAIATAAMLLGLAGASSFHVTPGYAYRLVQRALRASGNFGFLALLHSPWPVAQLLPILAARLRALRARGAAIDEDDLAREVVEASKAEYPQVLPSFLPPTTRRERLRLFEALGVLHAALTIAEVPYLAITGTLLGAMRHHGFIPWDGDADVCADIRDEYRLLRLALLQDFLGDVDAEAPAPSVARAAAALHAAGLEIFAHAERPLTFKVSGQAWPRVPGKQYGYPYVDVWFCHGWAGGPFSLQSAGFGVPMPRELIFPRRKLFFAGLPLWSFQDPRRSLSEYYGEGDWFKDCVGHATFHRQERKFSEDSEAQRFDGRVPCSTMSHLFAFASVPAEGPPEGVSADALLARIAAWLLVQPEPAWALDPDGPPDAAEGDVLREESWRRSRDQLREPLRLACAPLRPLALQRLRTSVLRGPSGSEPGRGVLQLLVEAELGLERPAGARCDAMVRLRPLPDSALDPQLLTAFAEPSGVARFGGQLLEGAAGEAWRLDVPSMVCRHRLGALRLVWAAEDASTGAPTGR